VIQLFARALIWAAALSAAANCQAVSGIIRDLPRDASALQIPQPTDDASDQWRLEWLTMELASDGRRLRPSRGRGGSLLSALADAIFEWSRSLLGLAHGELVLWAAQLSFGLLALCLSTPSTADDTPLARASAPGIASLISMTVPPRENAIFQPPPPSDETVYLPEGNGWIVVSDPWEYSRIPCLDCDDPNSIFYTYRANLFGIDVPDEWDFYNLISTDRPDFTDATFSVGTGVTIIETGYTYRRAFDHESNTVQSRRSLPEALVRYGLTDEFEIRFKWNGYVMSDVKDENTGARQQIFGGDDVITSIKYEVWQQNGALPMLTFLTGSTLPTGTNGISSNQMQPFVNFVGGWGLRRWLYLKISSGIDWQKSSISTLIGGGSEPFGPIVVFLRDNINVYHFSTSLLYQALPRVGGFAEFFGFAQTGGRDNRPAIYFDTGLYLYATTSVQFDVRYGIRLSERVDEFFTGAGFSVRY